MGNGHGGRRQGAGKPKGYKHAKTLEKEEARALLRKMVFEQMTPLVQAQIDNAKGLKYLIVRNKATGKFEKVTETMAKLKVGQDSDREVVEVWEKDPSVHAFTDLMNRAIDKPIEPMVDVNLSGKLEIGWKGE